MNTIGYSQQNRMSAKKKFLKSLAAFWILNLLVDICFPTMAYALTDGPSLPEVKSFEPVITTQMVDSHSGNFTYNIPLFNLPGPNGGYPFNLAYHSGIGMDQEASWVGLGWNLFSGAINRQIRNMPDDFKNDPVFVKRDIKGDWTVGVGGSVSGEVFGADFAQLGVSVGREFFYNYYKGVGVSTSFGIDTDLFSTSNYTANLGIDFDLNNQNGLTPNLSYSLESEVKKTIEGETSITTTSKGRELSAAAAYNVRLGLNGSLSGSLQKRTIEMGTAGPNYGIVISNEGYRIGGSSRMSFSGSNGIGFSTTPKMSGANAAFNIKFGGYGFGANPYGSIMGFFNTQSIPSKYKKGLNYKGTGFLYMDEIQDKHAIGDYSRENDGLLHKQTTHLAMPSMNYDSYMILGQGVGSMFRPHRSDLGTIKAQSYKSAIGGVNVGLEFAAGGGVKVGANFGANLTRSKVGAWGEGDLVSDPLRFRASGTTSDYERFYFKVYGEHTADKLNDIYDDKLLKNKAYSWELTKMNELGVYNALPTLKTTTHGRTEKEAFEVAKAIRNQRNSRATVVLPFTNEELLNTTNNQENLGEFNVNYYSLSGLNSYDKSSAYYVSSHATRASLPKHHMGGYSVMNAGGMRYIYGLPAINKTHKEYAFSVDGTAYEEDFCVDDIDFDFNASKEIDYKLENQVSSQDFYMEQEMPDYAHSYLLTSVLGADYVDTDNVPGPSEGDMGYWVKFDYIKTEEDYIWRAPYRGAAYMRGYESTLKDDKATFSTGEKEILYLATAETKTHVAEFEISTRKDLRGAYSTHVHLNDQNQGAESYKLDKIRLYSKHERYNADGSINTNAVAEKTIEFKYTYDLCPGVPNNDGQNAGEEYYSGKDINEKGGKLTLKKVIINHKNSTRGQLNPYVFDYKERDENNEIDGDHNPAYDRTSVDRWGNYRPYGFPEALGQGSCSNKENTYVDQYRSASEHNQNASVWNLKEITLPSGGSMEIEYEADRYGYVQDEIAMQMTTIAKIDKANPQADGKYILPDGKQAASSGTDSRRIYFELEEPLAPAAVSTTILQKQAVSRYIQKGEDLYFKLRMNIGRQGKNLWQYVAGYVEVEDVGIDLGTTSSENGFYTQGYIDLAQAKKGSSKNPEKVINYHPFMVAAWEHIRANQPDLMYEYGYAKKVDKPSSMTTKDKGRAVRNLLGWVTDISQMIRGVYNHLYKMDFGKEIKPQESFIRLRTPDKIKFGGGNRVKSIVFKDNWDQMSGEEGTVSGQVYLYNEYDEDLGKEISSGVATYEPLIGGDEIALRKPKRFTQRMPFKTNHNHYFELPINEGLYPGASVGYGKVTTMSYATYQKISDNPAYLDHSYTTGKTVQEFYTARDFPVLTDATPLYSKKERDASGNKTTNDDCTRCKFDLIIPVPFIGSWTTHRLTASQGYSIVLNDMPGKVKRVSQYGQQANGSFIEKPLNYVEYLYQREDMDTYSGGLDNTVEVILANEDPNDASKALIESREMGVEVDFVTDMREDGTFSVSGGVDVNTEVPFFPLPVPWPNYSQSINNARTIVNNKVIHKFGILKKVRAFDGAAIVETENKYFDPLTGGALLTTVNNNFNNQVYSYSTPARWVYDQMGAAYKNIGFEFDADIQVEHFEKKHYRLNNASSSAGLHLVPGDELLVFNQETGEYGTKATYLEKLDNNGLLVVTDEQIINYKGTTSGTHFKVVRSGRKNHLGASYSAVTALSDPTKNRIDGGVKTISKVVPQKSGDEYVIGSKVIFESSRKMNDVLGVSGIRYSDVWDTRRKYKFDKQNAAPPGGTNPLAYEERYINPYKNGELGFWRVKQNYVYVGDRTQSSEVDLSRDGVVNNVEVFYPNLVRGESYENWKMTGQVTAINDENYELENRNILDIHSSALYGYGGDVNIAVAGNAQYEEIGFEGFETRDVGGLKDISAEEDQGGNLSFSHNSSTTGVMDVQAYDIIGAQGNLVLVNADVSNRIDLTKANYVKLLIEAPAVRGALGGVVYEAEKLVTEANMVTSGLITSEGEYKGKLVLELQNGLPNFTNSANRYWEGKVILQSSRGFTNSFETYNQAEFTALDAHTGKQSLKVSQTAQFTEYKLDLKKNERYKFSAWVKASVKDKQQNNLPKSYGNLSNHGVEFKLGYYELGAGPYIDFTSTLTDFKGQIINGWQKVEFVFEPTISHPIFDLEINPGMAEYVLVDDVRIQPADGAMVTYVYDPSDMRLQAVLDDNNYATLYFYDEEGGLHLTKKETNEGIKTFSESRGHIQKGITQ